MPPPDNAAQPSAGASVRGGFFGCFGVLDAVLVALAVLVVWVLGGPELAIVTVIVGYLAVMLVRWLAMGGKPPWEW